VLLVPNHHVIVPNTTDLAVETESAAHDGNDIVYIELYGDSIMCGRDPDLFDDPCGCSPRSTIGRVPQPPSRLIEIFLPQYKLVVTSRSSGLSTAADLLDGNDGVNGPWPDYQDANIVVVNHGLNDARYNVPVGEYEETLRQLRITLPPDKIMVWQTPTVARSVDTTEYAAAMRRVAAEYNDIVADAHKISRWLGELPDGMHPRQLGYAELVDLCLSSAINQAIIKHLGIEVEIPHKFLRKNYQEKHVLEEQNWVQLGFTPKARSWVEVYHRDNVSYRAVSRGQLDTKGILTSGVWNGDNSEKLVSTDRSYNFAKIKRDSGRLVYNKNYDVFEDVEQANQLANDLNETNSDYIVVITTYDEPQTNRLTQRLADAMYRCGASLEIYGSENFKYRSSYILVGIPGCGPGNGLESYSGVVDGRPDDIANVYAAGDTVDAAEQLYYQTGGTNSNWTELLNSYSVWEPELSADVSDEPRTIDANFIGDASSSTIKSDGMLNTGGVKPVARWFVMPDSTVKEIVEPIAATVDLVNLVISDTPDCGAAGMQFGIQGISYISTASVPKLQLTADTRIPFTIEAVVWPLEGGGGGMIINKDSEYEMALDPSGNIMVALDWGVGTDVDRPGGGWYYTNINIPWNTRTHIAWVVDGTEFRIFVNGYMLYAVTGLDRVDAPSDNPVFIGNRPGESQQFTGYILDVRIWNIGFNAIDFNITRDYLELTDIPFYVGVAPMLENFVPDNGSKPDDDLVIIGDAVTENELLTYGIYSTITDLLRGKPGAEVLWEVDFTAERNIKIGYWQWDIRKYPTVTVPNILYENEYQVRTTDQVSGSFTIPDSFTDKSIIIFGVGDWDPVPPTGLQDVTVRLSGTGKRVDWSGDYYVWQVFFPSRGNYVFSLSADNLAYLDILPDGTNVDYQRVVSALDQCKGYDAVTEATYAIPKCGWYKVRIYAENTRDQISPPKYYTGYQIAFTTWSLLLRTYAIAIETNTAGQQWELYLTDDEYTVEFSTSVSGLVRFFKQDSSYSDQDNSDAVIQDTEFSTFVASGPFEAGLDPTNAVTTFSSTRTLGQGWYIISIVTDSVSLFLPDSFVAARIKNKVGQTIWTTRDARNPRSLDEKSVAATIKTVNGRMIWNTRNAYNEKDFGDFASRRVVDPMATYSEIEFEIAPNGTPFPVDIYPPRPEYFDSTGNLQLLKSSSSYDVVSNVPPINGTRLLNAKYNKLDFAAAPDTFKITHDNRLVFTRPISGVVTVVADNTYLFPRNSVQIDFTNIQSLDYYRQRFNPARYAAGYDFAADPTTTFGVAATGNSAPRQANSVVMTTEVLASANVYNAGVYKRVGDSHFAEPMVISQPQHGYARISPDRTSIVYVPFPDYAGLDSFSYTLLSQHGQAGMTKGIYVEVGPPNPPPPPPPPPPPSPITVVPRRARILETDQYFEWIITKNITANVSVRFGTSGTVTPFLDYWDQIYYATLENAARSMFIAIFTRAPILLTEPVYIVRVGPIIDDPDLEGTETLYLTVVDTDTKTTLAVSGIDIVDA
jgi:Concanavalin A-like lectin/glucanases superfamily/GDSL-like Lipase/Acylhydrolase family/Interleukin-like EMT inducer